MNLKTGMLLLLVGSMGLLAVGCSKSPDFSELMPKALTECKNGTARMTLTKGTWTKTATFECVWKMKDGKTVSDR